MSEVKVYPVSPEAKARALIDESQYRAMYQHSIEDPEGFWGEQGISS